MLTLEIGTILLDVYSGDLLVGNATLADLTLYPGPNKHPLTGILDLHVILTNLSDVLKTQAKAIRNGTLSLDTITRTVTWNGTQVPYYTKVMHELTLTADVGLGDILKNTIHNALHGGNTTSILQNAKNGSGSNSTGLLSDLKEKVSTSKALETRGDSLGIAHALKENVHVREIFKREDPVKRDAIIDTLAEWYTKV